MAASFLLHSQRVWWRAALFQVHLWVGLILGLYICAVGISGSIIVLGEELTRFFRPALIRPGPQGQQTRYEAVATIAADVKSRFPGYGFSEIFSDFSNELAFRPRMLRP